MSKTVKRFKFNIAQQFAIIPTFWIIWGYGDWKFSIAFMWLRFQARIAFGRR